MFLKVSNYTFALSQQAYAAYKCHNTAPPTLRKPQNAAFQRGFSPFYPNMIVSNVRSRHPAVPCRLHIIMFSFQGAQRVTQLDYWYT